MQTQTVSPNRILREVNLGNSRRKMIEIPDIDLMPASALLRQRDLEALVNKSLAWERSQHKDLLPPAIRVGVRGVRYKVSDVREWLAKMVEGAV